MTATYSSRQRLLSAIGVWVAIVGLARAGDPVAAGIDFHLSDAAGKRHTLSDFKNKKAIVAVFLSFECPVSNSYASVLAELCAKYDPQGVAFVGIDSVDDLDAGQVAKSGAERKLPFPIYADPQQQAADRLGATVVPQVVVLDHDLTVRYRGRIDDGWAARLRKNAAVQRHDLVDVLDALLAGKAVAEPETKAIGCSIPRRAAAPANGAVTYYRDVLPVLQERCQQCHRPGEVGPFSLMTYKQAVNWSADLKEYTQSRRMPPWKPIAGAAFHNERKLTVKEIATVAAWVDGGTPEGNPADAPAPRKFVEGWQLGTPDLVLTIPEEMTVGASGDDLFRCFVLPTHLTEDKYVVAMEVRPGNTKVVHHTLNFIDRTGQARKLEEQEQKRTKKPDEADHGPGYSVAMGIGFLPQGNLGGWAPGQLARTLPDGTGYLLPGGADVVIQVHYHRTGKVEKDRTSLGLYFARKPVAKPFKAMVIRGQFLLIPPASPHFHVQGGLEVEENCRLYSVMPHMHKLGREIAVTIVPPTGETTTLVAIKDWDYNWQETYLLKEPIDIKKGTKIRVEAYYDNSASNPNSQSRGRFPVFFGEQTTDEMCFIFLGATSDSFGRIRVRQERGLGPSRTPNKKLSATKPPGAAPMPEDAARDSGRAP